MIFFNNLLQHNAQKNINFNTTHHINNDTGFDRTSRGSSLSDCDAQQLQQQQRQQSQLNAKNSLIKKQSLPINYTISGNDNNYDKTCSSCSTLTEQIKELNQRLKIYEEMFILTPDVLKWFENMKIVYLSEYKKHLNQDSPNKSSSSSSGKKDDIDLTSNNFNLESLKQTINKINNSINDCYNKINSNKSGNSMISDQCKIPEIVIETV
jgi:hypothetical protein